VLLDVVLDLLGDYAWRAPADLVLAKYGDSHPTEVAALENRRLVACSEIDQGRTWHESRIKQLTGDGKISARKMRQDFYEFAQTAKFVIAANTRPAVKGTDNGIWRRMRYVPWTVRIPEGEQDRDLPRRLVAEEGPGILAWLVRGCLAWQRSGLGSALAIEEGTAAYRAEQDVIGNWIRDCCELDGWQASAALYESWCAWSKSEGMDKPWSKKVWKARLAEQWGVAEARREHGSVWALVGLRLKTAIEGYPA
jgi:putative DNA primase/helicase